MPPKQAVKSKAAKAGPPHEPTEDELLAKLAAKELEAASAREKLQHLAAAKEVLGADNFSLTAEVDRQRSNLRDINELLTAEVRSKAARAAAAEAGLAAARQELEGAARRVQEEVDRATQQLRSDLAGKGAQLAAAQERLRAHDAYLADKEKLQVQLRLLTEEIDELKKVHHKKIMDLERKHAQDRELWKRDTAAAVKTAREEMMALTDNRLETTTKRTILENEQMSGELQYQSRQVQNLVQRNEGLQRELQSLRVALGVAKKAEEELVRKNHLCEKTIETLLVRLEAQDAERGVGAAAAAAREAAERTAGLEEEVHMAVLQLDERARQMAALERELAAARREVERARAAQENMVTLFLEECLADVRVQQSSGEATAEQQLDDTSASLSDAMLQGPPLVQQEQVLEHLLRKLGVQQGCC